MKFHSCAVAETAAVFAFGLFLAVSPAAAECNPDTALFADEFDFMDPSWGEPNENLSVENGALILKGNYGIVNFSTQSEGADVCADLTIVDAPKIPNNPIAIVFWWQDWDNYYAMFYWANGAYEVRRTVKGKTRVLFSKETLALKKGVGATNHIELKLNPKDATIFINGTKVERFLGRPPKDGGVIGFDGASPEDAPATFAFDNLVVNLQDDSEK